MQYRPSEGSTSKARALRKNPTQTEKAMWNLLRVSFPEARFRRQVPIRMFIVDFASHAAKLVIEVDGGQHNQDIDAGRTKLIEAEGYRLLRFWNNDVLGNPDAIHSLIDHALHDLHPHPALPHRGGGFQKDEG